MLAQAGYAAVPDGCPFCKVYGYNVPACRACPIDYCFDTPYSSWYNCSTPANARKFYNWLVKKRAKELYAKMIT